MSVHLLQAKRKLTMLRITVEKRRGKTTLNVEGRLAGPWVTALEQCWRERTPGEKLCVDMCAVSFVDATGKLLLKEIHQEGGKLVAAGCLNQAIVDEISGGKRDEKGGRHEGKKGPHIFFY